MNLRTFALLRTGADKRPWIVIGGSFGGGMHIEMDAEYAARIKRLES